VGKMSEEEVAIKCLNGFSCPAQLKESIRYFATRKAMNIDGLGPAVIDQLVDTGLVKDVADLFDLKGSDVASLERMGEKSAENLLSALSNARKDATLPRLLTALGIPLVGEVAAADLAEFAGSVDRLLEKSHGELRAQLDSLHGIGPRMAAAIADFFSDARNRKVLRKLEEARVNPSRTKAVTKGKLKGLSFCITGTLSRPRDEVKAEIMRAGGKWSPSVTKDTTYLVAGDNVGDAKIADAKTKKVAVINEKKLYELLG